LRFCPHSNRDKASREKSKMFFPFHQFEAAEGLYRFGNDRKGRCLHSAGFSDEAEFPRSVWLAISSIFRKQLHQRLNT
jgi:hypothetical protein